MSGPLELIVSENKAFFDGLDRERAEKVKSYLDLVLSFAYGRATNQYNSPDQFAMIRDDALGGLGSAQRILHKSGYVVPGHDAIYVATDKGIKFMEDNYSGQELWRVRIK